MKKFNKSIIGLALLALGACNMLDINESIGTQKNTIFQYVDQSKKALTYVYTFLPSDFRGVDGTSRSCATDDAVNAWTTSTVRIFNDGSWSPNITVDAQWSNYYTAIRAANLFLENFNLKALEQYNNYPDYEDQKKIFMNYYHEARFLRAFYHFELAKRYGDIPLVNKVLTESEANNIARTPFSDVVVFIAGECDSVAKYLPVSYTKMPGATQETGRVTKGAAMALKSRALLYAASELHNPTKDVEKWKMAAKAAQDIIDSAIVRNWYALTPNFFDYNVATSRELIMETREAKANYFEKANLPIGFEGGNSGICPTQNLVDAFERLSTANGGGEFDWNNPIHAANPYASRDLRLARTVVCDGNFLKSVEVQTWIGGTNAQPKTGATPTGYYLRKFIDPAVNLNPSVGAITTSDHFWPIFRYSEILLNYAEAMSEAFPANTTYTDGTYTRSAEWAINQLRSRARINQVANLDYAAFQRKLRNERRVELAFEDHRFWDVRRWKIASQSTTILGTKIEKSGTTKTYSPNQVVATRVWNDKMLLYPIPIAETLTNSNLGQNPGW